MPVSANLIFKQIKRFESLTSRKMDEQDLEIHMDEWVKNFGSWDEEDFLTVCEEMKKTAAFFPKLSEMHKAYQALARKIDNRGQKTYSGGASQTHGRLWVEVGKLERAEKYDLALTVVGQMEDAGIPKHLTSPLRMRITSKLYGDERGALGAAYDAAKHLPHPLGQYVINQQTKIMEAKEAGREPERHTSSGSAMSLGDAIGGMQSVNRKVDDDYTF